MAPFQFPDLSLAAWKPTRDCLHTYAQVLGKIRQALTPPSKHWWHISLKVTPSGIYTDSIPAGPASRAHAFDLLLDLTAQQLVLRTDRGERWQCSLAGHSAASFREKILGALSELGIRPEIDAKLFQETQAMDYREDHAQTFLQAIVQVDLLLKQFRGELREETSEVQIFPHHFDLSFAWFSGRLVPGRDPRDAENADEQMTFGFSTGDEGTPDPYFYATAYPLPEGFLAKPLPEPASWHLEGWKGALLPYSSWVNQPDPQPRLLDFLRQAQKAGASLMK